MPATKRKTLPLGIHAEPVLLDRPFFMDILKKSMKQNLGDDLLATTTHDTIWTLRGGLQFAFERPSRWNSHMLSFELYGPSRLKGHVMVERPGELHVTLNGHHMYGADSEDLKNVPRKWDKNRHPEVRALILKAFGLTDT